MNFLADENVDQQIVDQLRENDHGVLYVPEMTPGVSDEEILAKANQSNALLLTADKDFGELVFRLRKISAGVMLMRLAGLSSTTKAAIVTAAVREHGSDFLHAFTVLTPGAIRIRSTRN